MIDIDIDVERMWENSIGNGIYNFSAEEQMQLKIVFFAGVQSMIHVNSVLHSECEDKQDYINKLKLLHDECVEFDKIIALMNKRNNPEKPALKLV